MKLIEKLFMIQEMQLSVPKDGKNPHFKSEYITLDNLVTVLQPICNEMKLLITHRTVGMSVITEIINIEGDDTIVSHFSLSDVSNPQKVGSAISYAKRYNLCQIFNVISDKDDDGNAGSIKDVLVKSPFTNEDLQSLKNNAKFKTAKGAISAVEHKRILTDPDREAIGFLYE